ncbi:hypothetical protein Tco_0227704 [Tanacetum coccineum]
MDASGGSGSNSPFWLIVDDNDAVDMNGIMDNLEERIANLEMVFAYLKNKKMLERQENKPKKETPSSDGTTSEDIAEFEVASKSTSSTSKPKKVTAHKVVTQKIQTKAFPVKIHVPINNCILGLAAAHTWACTGNKTFGTRKQKYAIVAGQARKGKKKQRRKIPIIDTPAGIFAHHLTSLFECDFVSLDSRLNSKKSTMDHSFGSAEEVDHVRILQSCNGLLLCSGSAWPVFYYVYNPSINLFKWIPQPKYYLRDDSCFFSSGVFRLAFDPRKSSHYKVVQAGGEASETWIQIYSSETGN